jgi:hypothetical protein
MDMCWPFCNWQKCGYSSNVQIKYMYCFLLHIFTFQLSSALTPTPTPLPQSMPAWTHLRPPKSTTHLATFVIDCIETRGVGGHLESGWRGGGGAYLTFYGKHFISNWFFSIKENNVKLTRDLKPLFVCFFVKKKLNYFACQFFKLPPSCVHQKLPPSFWSISKGLSSPL